RRDHPSGPPRTQGRDRRSWSRRIAALPPAAGRPMRAWPGQSLRRECAVVQRVLILAGPTASGKSAAALALARERPITVVNADALQVYRDLSVLTARPRAEE